MKIHIPEEVIDYYTDILCHCYEANGDRLAIGTTTGKFFVMERDDKNEMQYLTDTTLPGEAAVLGLHWSSEGIFVGPSKSSMCLLKPDDIHQQVDSAPLPFVKFEGPPVNDICSQSPTNNTVFGACDDAKLRVWNVETQQQICELSDHRTAVEVCNSNNEYLVSGSQDGKIFVYDSGLRTNKPVISFDVGKQVVCGLDISKDSTWVAAGCKGSPTIYNLRSNATIPQIEVEKPERIYTVHFDGKNNLWWAGGGTVAYRSGNLTNVGAELKTSYGSTQIHHIFSITSNKTSVSIAGSSTAILFTENGDYWEDMVRL